MKKKMMIAGLLFVAFGFQGVHANEYSEKTQYLGVVNGQVVGNSMVKVTRLPTDPVLYRSDDGVLPVQLRIRDAEVRLASGGMAYITVKQMLPDNQETRIILKTSLVVDGQKTVVNASQQGEDVLIAVPKAQKQVELRSDVPADLEIPVNYRGNIQIVLQVEEGN
ncbi:TPA: fimbrial protein [Escherichia coli]|nr:fimbrial protein [Escherichia coli]